MISFLSYMAFWILELEMFPYFDIGHNLLACLDVRNDWGHSFTKKNPIISWLFTILCIFSGSLIANFLLGQSILAPLSNTKLLILATAVWFSVTYSPADIVYQLGTSFPIQLIANVLKEIYRAKKISNGILQASQFYPNSWMILFLIAIIRGNGAGVTKQICEMVQSARSVDSLKNVKTSLSTKSTMLAAFIFIVKYKTTYLTYSYELVHLAVVLFLVLGKVFALLLQHIEKEKGKKIKITNIKKDN